MHRALTDAIDLGSITNNGSIINNNSTYMQPTSLLLPRLHANVHIYTQVKPTTNCPVSLLSSPMYHLSLRCVFGCFPSKSYISISYISMLYISILVLLADTFGSKPIFASKLIMVSQYIWFFILINAKKDTLKRQLIPLMTRWTATHVNGISRFTLLHRLRYSNQCSALHPDFHRLRH